MSEPLPTAKLRTEFHPTNRPHTTGIGVFIDGKLAAVATLEDSLPAAIDTVVAGVEKRIGETEKCGLDHVDPDWYSCLNVLHDLRTEASSEAPARETEG